MQLEALDVPRLLQRAQHYAKKAGASPDNIERMLAMLQSPEGQAVLQMATDDSLGRLLVNDLYKVHMHNMYAQFMTGVTADFALNIRRCQRFSDAAHGSSAAAKSSSSSAANSSSGVSADAYVLADIQQEHPDIFKALTERVCHQLQSLTPLDPLVLTALQELNDWTPDQALLDRAAAVGVAPATWVDIQGAPVAIGSGPIEAASNTETSVMQAVQEAIIRSAAQHHTHNLCNNSSNATNISDQQQQQQQQQLPAGLQAPAATEAGTPTASSAHMSAGTAPISSTPGPVTADSTADSNRGSSDGSSSRLPPPPPPPPPAAAAAAGVSCSVLLDRTERLANSLGRMVCTVQDLNDTHHGCDIMLMAGRRSTDLLHLLLQNLFFMKHVTGYKGTSSLLAAAVLRQLLQQCGVDEGERRALMGRVMGTHAHEMTSLVQQLMAGFDEEAGRRCGLQVPVVISQLLAHLLFLTANGPGKSSSSSSSSNSSSSNMEVTVGTDAAAAAAAAVNNSSISSDNGGVLGVYGTALPDTFTTPSFVALSLLADVPPGFMSDMKERWGVEVEEGSKVFDLFSIWRLDSGNYPDLAQLIHNTWTTRNATRGAAGLRPLAPLQLLYSDISSVDDIRKVVSLPPTIRPSMLGFGGLADGFMPFDLTATPPTQPTPPTPAAAVPAAAAAAPAGPANLAGPDSTTNSDAPDHNQAHKASTSPPPAAAAAAAGVTNLTLPTCSLVMKAVQGRPPGGRWPTPQQAQQDDPGVSDVSHDAAITGGSSTSTSSRPPTAAPEQPEQHSPTTHTGSTTSGANVLPPNHRSAAPTLINSSNMSSNPNSSRACTPEQQQQQQQCTAPAAPTASAPQQHPPAPPPPPSPQASAVKLGDGSLGKAQVDPRLDQGARQHLLTRLQGGAAAAAGALGEDGTAAAGVLREGGVAAGVLREGPHGAVVCGLLQEAYEAVVRGGVLMEQPAALQG